MLTPYQFAGNSPIWAIDLDGLEPLIATDYKSLTDLKADIKIANFKHSGNQMLIVSNTYHGMHVGDMMYSGMTNQEDLKKARDGGFWTKAMTAITHPSAVYYKSDLEKIEKMSYRAKNDQNLAFQDVANSLKSKTKGSRGTIDNTYLHVAGQAFITALFGEGAANYAGHLHEASHESLFTGAPKNSLDEGKMIDNYVDLITNQWGQEFGKQIINELNINPSDEWTTDNTANFLNKLQEKISNTMKVEFSSEYSSEDQFIINLTEFINENK